MHNINLFVVNAMDLEALERKEASLGKLLKALRHKFQEWERAEHDPQSNQSPNPDNLSS